jgi:hypothetical protein
MIVLPSSDALERRDPSRRPQAVTPPGFRF